MRNLFFVLLLILFPTILSADAFLSGLAYVGIQTTPANEYLWGNIVMATPFALSVFLVCFGARRRMYRFSNMGVTIPSLCFGGWWSLSSGAGFESMSGMVNSILFWFSVILIVIWVITFVLTFDIETQKNLNFVSVVVGSLILRGAGLISMDVFLLIFFGGILSFGLEKLTSLALFRKIDYVEKWDIF